MTLAIVFSRASAGIDAPLVTVETHVSRGLPRVNIVGLPEAAVKESRDRVRSALINTGFEFPARRVTVNLAPADLPKDGGRFDLPIALGILVATGQLPAQKLLDHEFLGELALSGEVRAVRGVLPVALAAKQAGRVLVVPQANEPEAALVKEALALHANHLLNVCAYLKGEAALTHCKLEEHPLRKRSSLNLSDVRGQPHAKRALEIAAAGKHNLLLIGPPGTGKTMLASRLPSILPSVTDAEALEIATIASISRTGFDVSTWGELPFRAPHHSSSSVALVGGGRPPQPGEISLAHRGILFLDELPEYSKHVLESLREPLESGHITISRAAFQSVFPAEFQLIAAMNPCPCGYAGSATHDCSCSREQVQRYMNKISGPLLDRIDMHVEVSSLSPQVLAMMSEQQDESELVKARVLSAQQQQYNRQGKYNTALHVKELDAHCVLQEDSQRLLNHVMQKFNLSARAYHRIIKISRTIADLSGCSMIQQSHLSEALTYRCLDRARLIT